MAAGDELEAEGITAPSPERRRNRPVAGPGLAALSPELRTVAEASSDLFGFCSAVRDETGAIVRFRLEYVNAAALAANGGTCEGQAGRCLFELLLARRANGLFDRCREVVETGRPYALDRLPVNDAGTDPPVRRWFDLRVSKLGDGFVATGRDVTEAHLQEENQARLFEQTVATLRESEQRFRLIADEMPQIVWVVDADDVPEYYNRRWYEYSGAPEGSLSRQPGWDAIHPEDQARVLEAWAVARGSGEPYVAESRLRGHDGTYRWHLIRGLPVRRDDGRLARWLGTSTDIDDRKRLEEDLLAAKRKVEEASRAKDRLLAVLSHELRSPLSPILLAASALAGDRRLPVDARRRAAMIEHNATLEARLIDDLLDLTRVEHGKLALDRRPVALRQVLDEAIQTCAGELAAKRLALEVNLAGAGAAVLDADALRLTQASWNLLANAIKFTPPGGTVRLTAREEEGWVVVEVADSGIGIEASRLPRVFDAFEQGPQTSRRDGGLGLGLTIAKAMVEAHGGSLTVASDGPGRGATFRMRLPKAAAEPAERRNP